MCRPEFAGAAPEASGEDLRGGPEHGGTTSWASRLNAPPAQPARRAQAPARRLA
ncbi:hypothetical protein [Pseudonocardia sp.]|uniref:hypothetical protein n=1 Tax=Pseudonocardia sp. TaxID=60912 RepID=UPI0031FDBFDE